MTNITTHHMGAEMLNRYRWMFLQRWFKNYQSFSCHLGLYGTNCLWVECILLGAGFFASCPDIVL